MLIVSRIDCTDDIFPDIKGICSTTTGVTGGMYNSYRKIGTLTGRYDTTHFTLHVYDTEDRTTEVINLQHFRELIMRLSREDIMLDSMFVGINYDTKYHSINIQIITEEMYHRFLKIKVSGGDISQDGTLLSFRGLVNNGVLTIPEGVVTFNDHNIPKMETCEEPIHTVILPDSLRRFTFGRTDNVCKFLTRMEIKNIDTLKLSYFIIEQPELTIVCRENCNLPKTKLRDLGYYCKGSIVNIITPKVVVRFDTNTGTIERKRR